MLVARVVAARSLEPAAPPAPVRAGRPLRSMQGPAATPPRPSRGMTDTPGDVAVSRRVLSPQAGRPRPVSRLPRPTRSPATTSTSRSTSPSVIAPDHTTSPASMASRPRGPRSSASSPAWTTRKALETSNRVRTSTVTETAPGDAGERPAQGGGAGAQHGDVRVVTRGRDGGPLRREGWWSPPSPPRPPPRPAHGRGIRRLGAPPPQPAPSAPDRPALLGGVELEDGRVQVRVDADLAGDPEPLLDHLAGREARAVLHHGPGRRERVAPA